jgi:hypothetical protein
MDSDTTLLPDRGRPGVPILNYRTQMVMAFGLGPDETPTPGPGADGQRRSYSLKGTSNPVVEILFARFKEESRDQLLEAKCLGELKEVLEEVLGHKTQDITREAG